MIDNISETNLTTLWISIVTCIFLYLVKTFINERHKEKLPAPLPIELIVVIVGTIVSYFMQLNEKYHVKIVGDVNQG